MYSDHVNTSHLSASPCINGASHVRILGGRGKNHKLREHAYEDHVVLMLRMLSKLLYRPCGLFMYILGERVCKLAFSNVRVLTSMTALFAGGSRFKIRAWSCTSKRHRVRAPKINDSCHDFVSTFGDRVCKHGVLKCTRADFENCPSGVL